MNFVAIQTQRKILIAGDLHENRSEGFVTLRGAEDITNIQAGYYKLFMLRSDHSIIAAGSDHLQLFNNRPKLNANAAQINQYLFGVPSDSIFNFVRMDFFDDKIIKKIQLLSCHLVVHCQDGMYAGGMNNIGRLGTGDDECRNVFIRINVDHESITNTQVTSSSFIEAHGKWLMAGSFFNVSRPQERRLAFTELEFTSLASLFPSKRNENCCIL